MQPSCLHSSDDKQTVYHVYFSPACRLKSETFGSQTQRFVHDGGGHDDDDVIDFDDFDDDVTGFGDLLAAINQCACGQQLLIVT